MSVFWFNFRTALGCLRRAYREIQGNHFAWAKAVFDRYGYRIPDAQLHRPAFPSGSLLHQNIALAQRAFRMNGRRRYHGRLIGFRLE